MIYLFLLVISIIASDLQLVAFNLTDFYISAIGENSILDRFSDKYPRLFFLKVFAIIIY